MPELEFIHITTCWYHGSFRTIIAWEHFSISRVQSAGRQRAVHGRWAQMPCSRCWRGSVGTQAKNAWARPAAVARRLLFGLPYTVIDRPRYSRHPRRLHGVWTYRSDLQPAVANRAAPKVDLDTITHLASSPPAYSPHDEQRSKFLTKLGIALGTEKQERSLI